MVTGVAQPWAFFGMPTRIWEFAAGGLAALAIAVERQRVAEDGHALQIAGLSRIAVATVVYHEAMPYPGIAALLPALGAVALIVGGHRSRRKAW